MGSETESVTKRPESATKEPESETNETRIGNHARIGN